MEHEEYMKTLNSYKHCELCRPDVTITMTNFEARNLLIALESVPNSDALEILISDICDKLYRKEH